MENWYPSLSVEAYFLNLSKMVCQLDKFDIKHSRLNQYPTGHLTVLEPQNPWIFKFINAGGHILRL